VPRYIRIAEGGAAEEGLGSREGEESNPGPTQVDNKLTK